MTAAEIAGCVIIGLIGLFVIISIIEMRGAKKSQEEKAQQQAAADARFSKIYHEVEQIEPKIDQTAD